MKQYLCSYNNLMVIQVKKTFVGLFFFFNVDIVTQVMALQAYVLLLGL